MCKTTKTMFFSLPRKITIIFFQSTTSNGTFYLILCTDVRKLDSETCFSICKIRWSHEKKCIILFSRFYSFKAVFDSSYSDTQ